MTRFNGRAIPRLYPKNPARHSSRVRSSGDSIHYNIECVGKIKSVLFGGEGQFFATLRGPGRNWLQSLLFSRLAGRITAASPRTGHGGREEGSVPGGLGRLVDGDNS